MKLMIEPRVIEIENEESKHYNIAVPIDVLEELTKNGIAMRESKGVAIEWLLLDDKGFFQKGLPIVTEKA